MSKFPFNVRVYVLLMDQNHERVILSDELIKGHRIMKFPGGGLEFGEGPAECAVREIEEELGIRIDLDGHFYTTDFFIQSAFNPEHQVVSIYYKAMAPEHIQTDSGLTEHLTAFQQEDAPERFFWQNIIDLMPEDLTFPGDRTVAERIRKFRFSGA